MIAKVIIAPKTLRFITRNFASAMALFPFVLLKDKQLKENATLLNHEYIHLSQQLELLIIPFYIWYILEYLIKRLKYKTHKDAYLNISFEREAYANELHINYLKERRFWQFLKYLKKA